MKILALDLGKFNTVACMYEKTESNRTANGETYHFTTVQTLRHDFTKLIKQEKADVLVFEICTAAGWLAHLCDELDQPYFVANPNGEVWRWSKTDRDDALKLARLTAMNQLPAVHMPTRDVRAKRSLLKFRQSIVERRVTLQNEIRALWQTQGLAPLPSGKADWNHHARTRSPAAGMRHRKLMARSTGNAAGAI